jgi:hypothetical protein
MLRNPEKRETLQIQTLRPGEKTEKRGKCDANTVGPGIS